MAGVPEHRIIALILRAPDRVDDATCAVDQLLLDVTHIKAVPKRRQHLVASFSGVGAEILDEAGVGECLADRHLIRIEVGKYRLLAVHTLHCAHGVGRHGVGALGSKPASGIDLDIERCNRACAARNGQDAGCGVVGDGIAAFGIHRGFVPIDVDLDIGTIDRA